MQSRISTTAFLLVALVVLPLTATARPAQHRLGVIHKSAAKAPATIDGTIDHFADGDTYWLKRTDGSQIKIREWVADSPEVAHNKKEADQPGGQDALKYATDHWKGKQVTVTVKGKSYDRIVGETVAKGETRAVGLDLVSVGLARVYPQSTPRPPQSYKDAEAAALEKRLGIFKDTKTPVAPWDWRKQSRNKERQPHGS